MTELPVKTSDLVYPALIQRCGMIFALLVFIVFIMMWLEGVRLFVRKQDRYHRAVGAGFVFMLFDQTLIIIAGSTGPTYRNHAAIYFKRRNFTYDQLYDRGTYRSGVK